MMQAVEGNASASTADQTLAEDAYDMVYAKLRSLHLAIWGGTGSVPDECVNPVIALVAESRLPFFKVPQDAQMHIKSMASTAIADLTEVQNKSHVPQETPAEYF